ncbi:MAG: CHAP domain-containing protein [bacterium]|nr:CHAP domain-containing protein [bacterium]
MSLAVIGLLIVAMFAAIAPVEARIPPSGSYYDREAIIREAYFAVMGDVNAFPGTTQQLGKWNFMDFDRPAQTRTINELGGVYYAGETTPIIDGWVKYGFNNSIGRGGQCLFFVNLLLYRSEADRTAGKFNSWSYDIYPYATEMTNDRPWPGDIIFKPADSTSQHIAIVVSRSGDNVGVIESNGVGISEAISHKITTIPTLRNKGYKVFTNVNYYNNNYYSNHYPS